MLSFIVFISFIVSLNSRISVWFFFLISISLLNFLLCSYIVFLISLSCLCCLIFHWASWKQFFWIICLAICRSSFLWSHLLEYYCVPLVVSCYLDFSDFFYPCVNVCIECSTYCYQTLDWFQCGKDFADGYGHGHWLGGMWQLLLQGGHRALVSVLVHQLRSAFAKITGVLCSACGKRPEQ